MTAAGFTHREIGGIDMFLDTPDAGPRHAVHVVFANEMVRPLEPMANPDVTESEQSPPFQVLSLEAIARIKLTALCDKDRTHLRDLIGAGLIDARWPNRLPPVLAERLRQILDTPES